MEKPGKLEVVAGRRKSGKKIDTWTFRHPEGAKIEVDVSLVTSGDSLTFHAISAAPILRGLSWDMSDIDALRKKVSSDLSDLLDSASDTDWRRAVMIETEKVFGHGSRDRFGLQITVTDLRVDAATYGGNDGTRRVMEDGRIHTISERALAESRPSDTVSGFRVETPKARALLEGAGPEDLEALRKTIDAFTEALAKRLGPDKLYRGLPEPEELVQMMQIAADETTGT